MTSILAYILTWIIWFRFKPTWRTADAFHARVRHSRTQPPPLPPANLEAKHNVVLTTRHDDNGFTIHDILPRPSQNHGDVNGNANASSSIEARILYLHGGACVFTLTPEHFHLAARLAARLRAHVVLPVYPLAPEHRLPAIHAMLRPVYHQLVLASRADGLPFVCAGDSAGANLAFVMTQRIIQEHNNNTMPTKASPSNMGEKQQQQQSPPIAHRLVLITPPCDSSVTNPDARALARDRDPWLDCPGIIEACKLMAPDLDPKDPFLSPLYGPLDHLPPMLVLAAERDVLTPDTLITVDKIRAKGGHVDLVEGPGMVHVWPLIYLLPEAKTAVNRIVDFIEATKVNKKEV